MPTNFDEVIDRRSSSSLKWRVYDPDVLPLWVADMDFPSPEPVHAALRRCIEYGIYGYSIDLPELKETICSRLAALQDWDVAPDDIVLLPGLVTGLNLVSRAYGEPGDGILVNTPVYPPFLTAPANQGKRLQCSRQSLRTDSDFLHYEIDFDSIEETINPYTRVFILCNPHNPTGRIYSRDELFRIARICENHDLVLCSDEIHSDLLLGSESHLSIAAIDPAIARRCVTLLAPSKTFNLPGLGCSIAVITNPELRSRFKKAARGIVPDPNLLGMYAALAAYAECEDWRRELIEYLRENRRLVTDFVSQHLPEIRTTQPQATYLAWLDCNNISAGEDPAEFFLTKARVALNDGREFGPGGEGFVRLNFGCPRSTLREALERMDRALSSS